MTPRLKPRAEAFPGDGDGFTRSLLAADGAGYTPLNHGKNFTFSSVGDWKVRVFWVFFASSAYSAGSTLKARACLYFD